jgi:peroxiredoxin Q/BCP
MALSSIPTEDWSVMTNTFRRRMIVAFALSLTATAAHAQQPTAAAAPAVTLKVGDAAPDFELRGATRYGLLATPVRLADHRGETVVIAFFYKARTKG